MLNSAATYFTYLIFVVGLGRFELPTSPLSGVRSNQLSYRPSDFNYAPLVGLGRFELAYGPRPHRHFTVKAFAFA